MTEMFKRIPEAREVLSNQQVPTIRGQLHKFMLIPIMEHHTRWFDAGPISIGVEARALGENADHMIVGPSIHVCNADRSEEYIRFDVFGKVLHYHYILNDADHNILWGYDPDVNGPMIPWAVSALQDRLPTLLRAAGAAELATQVEQTGWDVSVLDEVEKAASEALKPREDDIVRAKEGMDWMYKWKAVHPQFNTLDDCEY
ncbi:MAG: hypothetical protein H6917_11715 [Novosphingobium sp.]|nr:hypothetical protein [Novosphingobium sp.]MCP5403040.1 hypothetical protein [Novosphingobium sp.]